MQFPCNPLIEDYAEIFYMTDKGDIPYIQCKMSLKGPKSMRKIDGPSLILIDFYVPALTSRHVDPTKSKSKLRYHRRSVVQSVLE
jgi:hypothetical protein